MRPVSILSAVAVIGLSGCLAPDAMTTLVRSDPFSIPGGKKERVSYAPASLEVAKRVETTGQKLLAANAHVNVRPGFRTIGAPHLEIFHVTTDEINITEGLVNQCRTDAELAGVLAYELGKIVAEREAVTWSGGRVPDREPPPQVRIGNDYNSIGESPDLTRLAELSRYEKVHGPPNGQAAQPPDPSALAKSFLVRAGFSEHDLTQVLPILKSAGASSVFETQFRSAANLRK